MDLNILKMGSVLTFPFQEETTAEKDDGVDDPNIIFAQVCSIQSRIDL